MEHDTRDCNYHDEKLHAMLISKADCTAGDKILFSKLLDVSEVFWNFTCLFKLKLLCTQSRLIKSRGQNIKRRCYGVLQKTAILVKSSNYKHSFQQKKHPETVDTDNQTFNCDNADGPSQTCNWKNIGK